MKVISKQRNSRMCYMCGMDNEEGLRAPFYNMEDGSVMTQFMFRPAHQSFPGRVHGGLIATMFDELGFRAMWVNGSEFDFGVTLSLTTKFRKPTPYGEPLIGRGIVEKSSSKFVAAKAELFSRSGILLADAEIKYLKQPASRIAAGADPHEEMCYLIEDDVREIVL